MNIYMGIENAQDFQRDIRSQQHATAGPSNHLKPQDQWNLSAMRQNASAASAGSHPDTATHTADPMAMDLMHPFR